MEDVLELHNSTKSLFLNCSNHSCLQPPCDHDSLCPAEPHGYNETDYDYDYSAAVDTFFWAELIPPLVTYAVTYLIGVVGNGLIISIVCKDGRFKSATNIFLASLACADLLLILICIPVKLSRLFSYTWTLGYFPCKLLYYLQNISATCSVLTLTTISIERYYAVVYPLRAEYRCTPSQALYFCFFIWVLSCILASPILYVQVHMEVGSSRTAFWCVKDFDEPLLWRLYETYTIFLILIVPSGIMAGVYFVISRTVLRMAQARRTISRRGFANGIEGSEGAKSNKKSQDDSETKEVKQIIVMLMVVVSLFVICWAPILVINVLKAYGYIPPFSVFLKHVTTMADLLSYCNSCLNPVIYSFMSRNFRDKFQQTLCCSSAPKPRRFNSRSTTRMCNETSFTHVSMAVCNETLNCNRQPTFKPS